MDSTLPAESPHTLFFFKICFTIPQASPHLKSPCPSIQSWDHRLMPPYWLRCFWFCVSLAGLQLLVINTVQMLPWGFVDGVKVHHHLTLGSDSVQWRDLKVILHILWWGSSAFGQHLQATPTLQPALPHWPPCGLCLFISETVSSFPGWTQAPYCL